MKKVLLFLLPVSFLSLVSCNSNNIDPSSTQSQNTTPSTNSQSGTTNVVKSHFCDDYAMLTRYLNNKYCHKNNDYFYVLFPKNNVYYFMNGGYYITFNNDEDEFINNIIEGYFVYDEELGGVGDPSEDCYYYSFSLYCIFYPTVKDAVVTTLDVKEIASSELEINLYYNESKIGYIHTRYGEFDAKDYIINYVKENLRLI